MANFWDHIKDGAREVAVDRAGIRMEMGMVVLSSPDMNLYLVKPVNQPPKGFALYTGVALEGATAVTRMGVATGGGWAPGAMVMFIRDMSPGGFLSGDLVFILGAADVLWSREPKCAFPWAAGVDPQAPPPPFRALLLDLLYPETRSLTHGQSVNSTPGDHHVASPFGGGLKVGLFSSGLGSSPCARSEYDAMRGQAARFYLRLLEDSPASVKEIRIDCGAPSIMESWAHSLSAGLGAPGGPAMVEGPELEESVNAEWERVSRDPVTAAAVGFMDFNSFSGSLFHGKWDVVLAPGADTDVWTYGDTPVVLSSDRSTLDGRREIQAFDSVCVSRSPWLDTPKQVGQEELVEPGEDPKEDFLSDLDLGDVELSDVWGLISSKRRERNLLDREARMLSTGVDKDGEPAWVLVEGSESGELAGAVADAPPGTITKEDQGYKDIPEVEFEARQGSGAMSKLAALASLIELGPDGGIILKDGWGSEIRFHRGNITISPANDLHVRPGRNSFSMSPGFDVRLAGKDVEIWSEEGSVKVKAEKELSMVAGNGGEGRLVLDSRGTDDKKAGVLVRSKTTAAMVSRGDMRIGVSGAGKSKSGPDDGRSGLLWLDAGKGPVHISGDTVSSSAKSSLSMAVASAGGACLGLSGSGMAVLSQSLDVGASSVKLGTSTAGKAAPVHMAAGGPERVTPVKPSGNCNVVIGGSAQLSGSVSVAQGMQSSSVEAGSVTAGRGNFGNGSSDSGVSGGRGSGPTVKPPTIQAGNAGGAFNGAFGSLKAASRDSGVATDGYVNDLLLAYGDKAGPDEDGYFTKGHYIVLSAWQAGDHTKGGSWKHKPMMEPWEEGGDAFPYPGGDMWRDGKAVRSVDKDGKPIEVGSLMEAYNNGRGL